MTRRNEEVEAVFSELRAVGLKGHVEELGKHLQIAWVLPDGKTRGVVVAKTPSDRRGALNARAQVRRFLREDNVQPPTREQQVLRKALSLPDPSAQNTQERLDRLERDFLELLDWVGELQQQLKTPVLSAVPPQPTLNGIHAVLPRNAPLRPLKWEKLLNVIPAYWVTRQYLTTVADLPSNSLSATLSYLREKGLVERGQRGMWRRTQAAGLKGASASPVVELLAR